MYTVHVDLGHKADDWGVLRVSGSTLDLQIVDPAFIDGLQIRKRCQVSAKSRGDMKCYVHSLTMSVD